MSGKNSLDVISALDLPKFLGICIDRLNDAIVITEAEPINEPGPRIVWANKVFYERNGYTPDEIIGQSPRILQGAKTDRATLDRVRSTLEAWQSVRAEILNYRKDGSTYWNEFEIVPIANEKGWFTHWVSVQRDITERKNIEAQVYQLAFYDPLTSLPNRRLLNDHLKQVMVTSLRHNGYVVLMFLDLDNFKPINDTHGHKVGDLLLIEAATRLKNSVREADMVARFGGDEFVVMFGEPSSEAAIFQARVMAEKILCNLSAPYFLKPNPDEHPTVTVEHRCTASIGVAMTQNHPGCEDDILRLADIAMYQAKEAGGNRVIFYDEESMRSVR